MTQWTSHHTPLIPGRRRARPGRFRVGVLVGALVVLAAWGVSELMR